MMEPILKSKFVLENKYLKTRINDKVSIVKY